MPVLRADYVDEAASRNLCEVRDKGNGEEYLDLLKYLPAFCGSLFFGDTFSFLLDIPITHIQIRILKCVLYM